MLINDPVVIDGYWWAGIPLRRAPLELPDDSIPYEKDVKIMVKAYQKFYFAYYAKRSYGGATLGAGRIAVETTDIDRIRKYDSLGYKTVPAGLYRIYYYPIPKVDSLIVYVRSKEKYCSLVMIADIRMFNERGEKEVYEGWDTVKFILRKRNEWNRKAVYIPSIVAPRAGFQPIYGLEFSMWPAIGSTDSCATFEVGPIYLK